MTKHYHSHLTTLVCSIIGIIALSGCQDGSSQQALLPTPTGDRVASVNTKPVTEDMVAAYARQRAIPAEIPADLRPQVIQELVNVELLTQGALKENLHLLPDGQNELTVQQRVLLASKMIEKYLQTAPISDAEVQQAYEEQAQQNSGQEYRARHILTEKREAAEELIKQLQQGADFADLAKRNSIGPTGKNGGDLGWFTHDQMVVSFSNAVKSLTKGEFTASPIETRFGWHVILLENVREQKLPDFEQVKERLRTALEQQKVQKYIEGLREAAKIELHSKS